MKYIFLGSFYADTLLGDIKKFSLGPIGNANDLLQKNIIYGLVKKNKDVLLVTVPNVGSYPNRYKKWYVSKSIEYLSIGCNKVYCKSLSFINLPGVKHFFRFASILFFFIFNGFFKKKNLVLFVYDFEIEFLFASSILKKINRNLHICLIAPDLPGYTSERKSFLYNLYNAFVSKVLHFLNEDIDSYAFISEHMVNKIEVKDRPYVVIEGIYNIETSKILSSKEVPKEHVCKVVFYSGSLDERNGIVNLINAFKLITRDDYRLYIIGDGPLRDFVLKSQLEDVRIEYFGQIGHAETVLLQAQADILINPRLPLEEFTRYSFPSKTMEYLASGIPTLMYKLPGVPEEYFDYCIIIHGYSLSELAKTIEDTIETDYKFAKEKASSAVNFILSKKNPMSQCQKLIDMVEGKIQADFK